MIDNKKNQKNKAVVWDIDLFDKMQRQSEERKLGKHWFEST